MIYNDKLEYRVVDFIASSGQIIVECVGLNYKVTIDLPITDGKYLEGKELDTYIRGFIPTWVVDRSMNIKNGISNEDYFHALVNKSEEEKQISKENEIRARRDTALKDCDYTMLPDAGVTEKQLEKFLQYRQALRDVPQQPGFPDNVIWPTVTGEWPNRKGMN
jgi:hypothetical protein